MRLRVNELTWSNSLTVEGGRHRAIDTMISLSIPLVIFSLLSTRTIFRSTEHLELATHEENTPLNYPPLGNDLSIVKAASETKWY